MSVVRLTRLRAFWPEFILVPILIAAIYELIQVALAAPLSGLHRFLTVALVQALLLAAVVYIAAHVLRATRLSLLLGVGKLPFGAILGCHSVISFITFALPFKLGELARALEFYRLTDSNPAVIVLGLIELASSSMPDSSLSQLTRRGLLLLLGISLFIVLFGRSALAALLRLLSSSNSNRSLILMRYTRKIENFAHHVPPLKSANLALLLILTCAIWLLEILAVLIITIGLTGWHQGAIAALVGLISTAVIGVGSSAAMSIMLYRLLVTGSLAVLAALTARFYLAARLNSWPKDGLAQR